MVALDAMVKTPSSQLRVHVQSVEEVLGVKQEGIFFPLREAYVIANESLEGAVEHAAVQLGGTNFGLPQPVQDDVAEQIQEPVELVINPELQEESRPAGDIEKSVSRPTVV